MQTLAFDHFIDCSILRDWDSGPSMYTKNIGTNLGLITFVLRVMVNSLIIHEGNPKDI